MLGSLLGTRPGILGKLHEEHEEAASLLDRILKAQGKERLALFAELNEKLSVHLRAESKVLYAKLAKDEESRYFALEGDIEHDLALQLLDELSRARNKAGDEWLARVKVLKDLVEHHVEEEESEGWSNAKKQFDEAQLEKLLDEFEGEKKRLMGGEKRPARAKADPAYAGKKPRAKRAPAGRKKR
jgi:Hemerythrin HHE cation binding domain